MGFSHHDETRARSNLLARFLIPDEGNPVDPLPIAIIAIGVAHCLQIWAQHLERKWIMEGMDKLAASVAEAVAAMQRSAHDNEMLAQAQQDLANAQAQLADADAHAAELAAQLDAVSEPVPADPA